LGLELGGDLWGKRGKKGSSGSWIDKPTQLRRRKKRLKRRRERIGGKG